MTPAEIILNCQHSERYRSECTLRDGAKVLVCSDCWNASVAQRKRDRKAIIDAMPRCKVAGCKRRATWYVGTSELSDVGLCGSHRNKYRKNAHKQVASTTPTHLLLFSTLSFTRAQVLEFAARKC